jgi:integrase
VLHKSIDYAVKNQIVALNIMDSVQYPKVQRHEIKTLTETDIMILLEYAKESEYYPLWYTILFTGMRRGEALALTWGDLDLLDMKISVNKNMTYLDSAKKGEKIQFKAPKTDKSRRYISITPSNAVILREHKEAINKKRIALKLAELKDTDLIFRDFKTELPYTPNGITHAWIKLSRKCSLPGVRLHDCRHTYASLLLSKNVHPSIVAAQLGHASITTTLNTYSHITPALQDQAARAFDNIVMPNFVSKPNPPLANR